MEEAAEEVGCVSAACGWGCNNGGKFWGESAADEMMLGPVDCGDLYFDSYA